MSSAHNMTPKVVPLLIESSAGVTEYVIGTMSVDDKPVIGLLGTRVASGRGSSLDREKLQEAITLHQWAVTHLDVFEEGRVVYK